MSDLRQKEGAPGAPPAGPGQPGRWAFAIVAILCLGIVGTVGSVLAGMAAAHRFGAWTGVAAAAGVSWIGVRLFFAGLARLFRGVGP